MHGVRYGRDGGRHVYVVKECITTPFSLISEAMAKLESEVESLESLLETAGHRALTEHEQAEMKRILYGSPAQ